MAQRIALGLDYTWRNTPKRARSWKRRIQPRCGLKQAKPVLYSTQERLGKSDAGIILLRKIFRRELDAIKNSLPGKKWKPRTGLAKLPLSPGVVQVDEGD